MAKENKPYPNVWPHMEEDKEYHTVAECEAVIKSLREMIDDQQALIFKLQWELNQLKEKCYNMSTSPVIT